MGAPSAAQLNDGTYWVHGEPFAVFADDVFAGVFAHPLRRRGGGETTRTGHSFPTGTALLLFPSHFSLSEQ